MIIVDVACTSRTCPNITLFQKWSKYSKAGCTGQFLATLFLPYFNPCNPFLPSSLSISFCHKLRKDVSWVKRAVYWVWECWSPVMFQRRAQIASGVGNLSTSSFVQILDKSRLDSPISNNPFDCHSFLEWNSWVMVNFAFSFASPYKIRSQSYGWIKWPNKMKCKTV